MRNLEILTRFSNLLADLGGQIDQACLDEFGHTLYIFVKGSATLNIYSYASDIPSVLTPKKVVDFSD